jgi:hypothetical protein
VAARIALGAGMGAWSLAALAGVRDPSGWAHAGAAATILAAAALAVKPPALDPSLVTPGAVARTAVPWRIVAASGVLFTLVFLVHRFGSPPGEVLGSIAVLLGGVAFAAYRFGARLIRGISMARLAPLGRAIALAAAGGTAWMLITAGVHHTSIPDDYFASLRIAHELPPCAVDAPLTVHDTDTGPSILVDGCRYRTGWRRPDAAADGAAGYAGASAEWASLGEWIDLPVGSSLQLRSDADRHLHVLGTSNWDARAFDFAWKACRYPGRHAQDLRPPWAWLAGALVAVILAARLQRSRSLREGVLDLVESAARGRIRGHWIHYRDGRPPQRFEGASGRSGPVLVVAEERPTRFYRDAATLSLGDVVFGRRDALKRKAQANLVALDGWTLAVLAVGASPLAAWLLGSP